MSRKSLHSNSQPENAPSQEELQERYLRALDELAAGQLVEGSIVEITPEFVFVDIGYKSEGQIPVDEFEETPSIGDTVSVVLVTKESRSGGVVVSKRKADEQRHWLEIKQAEQDGKSVQGKVVRAVKGGFEVSLGPNITAFNPMSKMDIHRIEDPESFVGLESSFHIERLYRDRRVNIIVSRRSWLDEEIQRRKADFFSKVGVGDIVEGTVKSFTSFGSFIDLGGFDGLLHINDMSWGHVTRPKDYVKRGQTISLRVVRMDHENQKINLSLKDLTDNPWHTFEDRYSLNDVVKGTVTKLTDFGAFIELEEGIEGLAHISEFSWVKRINHPKEVLNIGDEVEARILGYDLDSFKVSLGLKQVFPNPWNDMETRFPVGMRLTRPVKKLTNSGAFVELDEGIDGFLSVDDLSWTKRYKNPAAVLAEGQDVECMVIAIDTENRRIQLGVKQLSEDPWQSLKTAYPEGTIIEGEITNITDFGIFVRVQSDIEGLINKSQVSDPRVVPYEEAVKAYKPGETVRVVVTEVSPSRQRLSLSLREVERKEQRAELQKYIHDDQDEATVTLGDLIKDQQSDLES